MEPVSSPAVGTPSEIIIGGNFFTQLKDLRLLSCSTQPLVRTTQVVGPEGGVILVGTHRLVIPAGALEESVTITAEQVPGRVNSVRFLPEGLKFERPAALSLSYANCSPAPPPQARGLHRRAAPHPGAAPVARQLATTRRSPGPCATSPGTPSHGSRVSGERSPLAARRGPESPVRRAAVLLEEAKGHERDGKVGDAIGAYREAAELANDRRGAPDRGGGAPAPRRGVPPSQ